MPKKTIQRKQLETNKQKKSYFDTKPIWISIKPIPFPPMKHVQF